MAWVVEEEGTYAILLANLDRYPLELYVKRALKAFLVRRFIVLRELVNALGYLGLVQMKAAACPGYLAENALYLSYHIQRHLRLAAVLYVLLNTSLLSLAS